MSGAMPASKTAVQHNINGELRCLSWRRYLGLCGLLCCAIGVYLACVLLSLTNLSPSIVVDVVEIRDTVQPNGTFVSARLLGAQITGLKPLPPMQLVLCSCKWTASNATDSMYFEGHSVKDGCINLSNDDPVNISSRIATDFQTLRALWSSAAVSIVCSVSVGIRLSASQIVLSTVEQSVEVRHDDFSKVFGAADVGFSGFSRSTSNSSRRYAARRRQ
jgi:hypothetical protein